MYSNLIKY